MNCFLIAAITADGFIAQNSDQLSTTWTSPEDKHWFNQRTKQAGVVVMGSNTFKTIGRALPGRLTIVYTREPHDSQDPHLRFTNIPPIELLSQLEKEKYSEVAICGGSSIYSMFMNAGLINKMYLTVEPVLFGEGVSLFSEPTHQKLSLVTTEQLNQHTLLLEYDVTSANRQS